MARFAGQELAGTSTRVIGQVRAADPLRFDPKRQAILLIAGDKAGNWQRSYNKHIPLADDLFEDHLRRLKGQ